MSQTGSRPKGAHRLPPPPSALRGRVVVAAVAAGAFVAAGAGQTLAPGGNSASASDEVAPLASGRSAVAALGMGGTAPSPEVVPLSSQVSDPSLEVEKLAKSQQLRAELAKRAEQEAERNRVKFVKPASGTFTSGYGARWGATHYGLDIANRIGTPIYTVADGTIIAAGPASGFGLWVKVLHHDGTTTVYGHVDRILVKEGKKVKAGEQIATMGNRGFSTGPHLHFEVWNSGGRKINPLPWLNERGVFVR
nr:M23 family metallopeptidase [Allokutzneria sp. NRRL B-24872]